MRRIPESPIPLLTWAAFDDAAVEVAVTTREGGVSARPWGPLNMSTGTDDEPTNVRANRERVAEALGMSLADMVFCRQAHGSGVTLVDGSDRGRGAFDADDAVPATDALVTRTPGVALAITAADCAPVVICDPVARVLACVHAGWRGVAGDVVRAAVAAMTELGADPARLVAGIGPTVSPRTYDVGDDVARPIRSVLGPQADQVLYPFTAGRYMLDIAGALHLQLADCGMRHDAVYLAGLATGADTPFFSHRAEQPCGRFALIARLTEEGS